MSASDPFLTFAQPDIGEEEIAEVVDALRSGWITTGPKTKQFERQFAEFLGGGLEAIAVNSATAGLHLALEALGVGPGDEVITTPYTFTATAEVVRYLGAHPVFVDVRSDSLNIDAAGIEDRITPRTKAIVVVHFAGLPCDMATVTEVGRRHGLAIVEDAAHAFPATIGDRLIGTLDSDVTVFSFYATKTITTGEGGMVVTRRPEVATRCRTMRLHGISRDAFDRYVSREPSWYYEVVAPGFKYNMTDVAAAMGIQQLRKAERFRSRRAEIAERYSAALRNLPLRLPAEGTPATSHAWHLYVIRLLPEFPLNREQFIERMSELGIGCSVHFIPLHLQPYWRETYQLVPGDFPRALEAYKSAVSLPLYTRMSDMDADRVVRAITTLANG